MNCYFLVVTLHVFAAVFWLGGLFFLALVGAPILRRVDSPVVRAQLFQALGLRFRRYGWVAIILLVVTGVLNLHLRGILAAAPWKHVGFWSTMYGRALLIKLVTVFLMIALSALHDFWLGPAVSRLAPGTDKAIILRRWTSWLARASAVLGILLLLSAVRLARG